MTQVLREKEGWERSREGLCLALRSEHAPGKSAYLGACDSLLIRPPARASRRPDDSIRCVCERERPLLLEGAGRKGGEWRELVATLMCGERETR